MLMGRIHSTGGVLFYHFCFRRMLSIGCCRMLVCPTSTQLQRTAVVCGPQDRTLPCRPSPLSPVHGPILRHARIARTFQRNRIFAKHRALWMFTVYTKPRPGSPDIDRVCLDG